MAGAATILIVGDWVVDEYWFLVGHQSDISSHTGQSHFRSSSSGEEVIRDLCGAGHVARVLHDLRGDNGSDYNIVGLGNWDEGDNELISHLFHKDCDVVRSKYQLRLTPENCQQQAGIRLISLSSDYGTTRVFRLYTDGGKMQLSRIDWELPTTVKSTGPNRKAVSEVLQKCDVKLIVICDHNKGVITKALAAELCSRYPCAQWYVRSKVKEPAWLEEIVGKIELKLMLIGPEVASGYNPVGNWMVNDKMSRQGLELLSNAPGKSVILLSDRKHVVAKLNNERDCVAGKSLYKIEKGADSVGWSSAVFASLIHTTHGKDDVTRDDLRDALVCAEKVSSAMRSKDPGASVVESRGDLVFISSDLWGDQAEEWKQAINSFGLIKRNGTHCLDVWRGSTDLPKYITCIEEKRHIVDEIGRRLKAFRSGGNRLRSLSIMLIADPGAGKTSLARSLAEAFDFEYIGCDLTQMVRREELLDLFDSIATLQASKGDRVLVFVDEINALLDGGYAYSAFLAPLEDGVYTRRGQKFSLSPCVWIFAGTGLKGDKVPDFESRMTLIERMDYVSLVANALRKGGEPGKKKLIEEARLEQLYLGASMIRRFHPDVTQVSLEVLLRFYGLEPATAPARIIRKRASLLRNVQYGQVTRNNWDNWDKYEEGEIDYDSIRDKWELVTLSF